MPDTVYQARLDVPGLPRLGRQVDESDQTRQGRALTEERQANRQDPGQERPKRFAVKSTKPRSPRPEAAQRPAGRVVVDAKLLGERADKHAARVHDGTLNGDPRVHRGVSRCDEGQDQEARRKWRWPGQ